VFGAAIVADREVADVVSNLPGHGPAVRAKRNCSLKLLGLQSRRTDVARRSLNGLGAVDCPASIGIDENDASLTPIHRLTSRAVRTRANDNARIARYREIASEMKIRQQGIRVSGLPRVFDYSVEAGYSYGRQHGRDRHSRKQLRYRKSSLSIYLQQAGSAPNKECAVLGPQQSVRRCREWFSAMSAFCVR
jgi:hypothetical protein